jgi:hypothetical protein
MHPSTYVFAGSGGTSYVTVATPTTFDPMNRNAPACVAIVTLWMIAASELVNAIRNAASAGAVMAVGLNRKSRASSAMTTGRGVGGGVGLAVGFAVGAGLGRAVGLTVGRTVGAAVRVGAGVGAVVGAGVAAAVGLAVGAGDGVDEADGDGGTTTVAAGVGLLDGALLPAARDEPGLGLTAEPGELEPTGLGVEPPQAAASRHAAASHARRGRGTAAL